MSRRARLRWPPLPRAGDGNRAAAETAYSSMAAAETLRARSFLIIFKVRLGGRRPWMWTLASGHHKDRTPTHGYEATREAAMAAFAKSWRRE